MLSMRCVLALCALCACAYALPASSERPVPRPITTITDDDFDDSPWFSFPLFGNLFAPLWRLLPSFGEIGPRIVATDDKFQVIVNVKDYSKDALKVKVKGDLVLVQGSRSAQRHEHDVFASQFFHTYSLPANASGDDVTADLTTDGYLVVGAPLRPTAVERTKEVDRDVPIVETGRPFKDETTSPSSTTAVVTKTTTLAEAEDDRREPTTPSTRRDDADDKENSIDQGNDVM